MGLCVQRALVSWDQPANALCTIVSITDKLLECNFAGCNPRQYFYMSVCVIERFRSITGVIINGYFVQLDMSNCHGDISVEIRAGPRTLEYGGA